MRDWVRLRWHNARLGLPRLVTERKESRHHPIERLGSAFGGILMIGSPRAGLVVLAAAAVEPAHLIGALLGLLMAEAFLRSIGSADPGLQGAVRANGILAGIAAAWLVAPMGQPLHVAVLFILLASGAAAVVAAALARVLVHAPVPPLSAAFAIVFGILLTILPYWAQAASLSDVVWPFPIGATGWLDSFLRSMGMILFSPRPVTGLLVLAAMMLWSRTMVLSGIVGWIFTVLTAELLSGFGFQWMWLISAHNGFIAGMLLGAVIYLPGWTTLFISALAGVSASILTLVTQTGFGGTGWAFQPLPALITIWVAILALSARSVPHAVVTSQRRDLPPEYAWKRAMLAEARFGAPEPLVAVPLSGTLMIGQSFGGPLSHRGAWSHGLDFEFPHDGGAPHGIYGARVYCPVAGVVELICDGIDDNPIGVSNYSQNWGNHVVIRMDQGFWLMLAHLGRGSIVVGPGQRVAVGQELASVGNSGRSPTPHLHMHVQAGPLAGAPTLPFKLANYLLVATGPDASPIWIQGGVPEAGQWVRAALRVPAGFSLASGLAPGVALWRVTSTGRIPARFARFSPSEYLSTTLDPAGNHCVTDGRGGRLVMRADVDGLRVHEIEGRPGLLLLLWSMGLPIIPYCATPGLTWNDRYSPPPVTWGDFVGAAILPYLSRAPLKLQLRCTAISDDASREMLVESRVMAPVDDGPVSIKARIAALKGPVAWDVQFSRGTIVAELVAFEPGMPA
ncbi:urea transporter [Labrys monachus]|uniref:Urea transporter n=1 Tax=Labrys monachus TaxID=217067 RepID=A0ABU0FIW0_9HYPH|nr:urea transporter [Labrys monachus]MDQ0394553.1 urea transporter [Labrys monachus]